MLTVYVYKSIGQFNVKYILTVHVCAIMQVHECLRSMSFYSVYTAQCDQISTCIMIWYAYFSTEDKNGPPNALLLDHQLHRAPWKPLFSVRLPVRLERTPLLSRQDFQEESTKRFVSLFFGSGKLVFIGTFWTSRPEHFQTFSDTMSCLSCFRKLHTSPQQTNCITFGDNRRLCATLGWWQQNNVNKNGRTFHSQSMCNTSSAQGL